jgi:hypothetical protein
MMLSWLFYYKHIELHVMHVKQWTLTVAHIIARCMLFELKYILSV